jgi:hypothetical protein
VTAALEVLLFVAAVWLLSLLGALRAARREDGPPVMVYRPGDAWEAKGRRGR